MSFHDLQAKLDAAAFSRLSDDTACVWTRTSGTVVMIAAMLEAGERTVQPGGVPGVMSAEVVRVSAAEVRAKADPVSPPSEGDTITINGARFVVHGVAYLDEEMGGRDWICPVIRG